MEIGVSNLVLDEVSAKHIHMASRCPGWHNIVMQPELWAEIKRLGQAEKLKISEIARRVRVDRKTVRRVLASEGLPVVTRTPRQPSKLEPYKKYIEERLKTYPHLCGSVIYDELRRQGYTGKIRILREYLAAVRPNQKEVYLRIETAPGEQMQVDWANCGSIVVGQATRKLSAFVAVLSYSRLMYLEFTLSQCQEDFIRCHINAFRYFSGICRKILYDNLKLVVLSRVGSEVRFNPRFLEFSGVFGFEPILCNVARGNEKGKVENGIRYIRDSFLEGREIKSWAELQCQAVQWLNEVANVRLHRTTQEQPVKRWERERGLLQALPCREYDASILRIGRSTHQALVSFDGNVYTVPPAYAYKTVAIRADEREVWILSDSLEVARHRRSYDRGAVIEDPKHVAGIVALKRRAFTARQEKRFLGFGPEAKEYYEGLLSNQVHPVRHIAKIMELAATYGEPEVLAAVREALKYKAYGAAYVQSILFQKRTAKGLSEILPLAIPQKPDWNEIHTKQPDLDIYDKLLEIDNSGEDKKDEQPKS